MVKLWICLALIVSISSNAYAGSKEQEDLYDDYYLNDMDQDIFKPVSDIFKTTIPDSFMNPDSKEVNDESSEIINYEDEKKFEDELDQYYKNNKFVPKADGNLDDYQFEDNRSEVEVGSSDEGGDLIRPLSGIISYDDSKEENVDKPIELPTGLPKVYEDVDKTILEETKSILDEDTINEFDNDKTLDENPVNDDNSMIFEETSKILEESYSNEKTDKVYNNSGEEINNVSESLEDFDKIVKTTPTVEGNTEEEDTVNKAYNGLTTDLYKLQETWNKLNELEENRNDFGSDEKKQEIESSEDYEEIDDDPNMFEKIFESDSNRENGIEDKIELSDEKLLNDGSQAPPKIHKVLPYINDGLVASDVERNLPTSTDSSAEEAITKASILIQDQTAIVVEDNLIKEFIQDHQSVFDVKASDVRNAINVRLTIDRSEEVTSPDYPLPYPTNNVVDWMFTGDGMGIELNITDFSVNGHRGDYLLVKPGGVDESGSTGIIFTYNLRTERRYRFLDVDKMFVRFVANPGNQFMKGFKFSARMVVPRPGGLVEPEPEPEPSLPDPPATITVNLGGIALQNFLHIEEEFRHIIADMATLYINTHEINPGVNTTLESTQITSRAICFHNWPKFELCTEVQFGVPIVQGEKNDTIDRLNVEDLMDMWTLYSQRDPFAVRLRILGITVFPNVPEQVVPKIGPLSKRLNCIFQEYQVPDDARVLTLWLIVAGGVVISAALLALALWRFSCFEDYTRMPLYSDTDSITEKRTLDLYPTPHQTLPPLYTETDYQWTHDNYDTDKVDMGLPNKSFLPDDAFEALGGAPGRDRNFSFSPRDVYDV